MTPFGKFTLLERLGQGGMAEVWKARIDGPAGFVRKVVLKRLLPQMYRSPDLVQMFIGEARLAARLHHPNVVQVLELSTVADEYVIVMEYIHGHNLAAVTGALRDRGTLTPGFAAFVLREVARGLGYAHALPDDDGRPLRLIHRDVSPSNIMLSFDGTVKLVDFGIAKAFGIAQGVRTERGALKGKFGYMSPEQAQHLDLDLRSDLFSAGIVLYETLTGQRLFKGKNDPQTLQNVIALPILPPSKHNLKVPPELDRICLKALNRDRAARYGSGEELALELDELVHQLRWGPERLTSTMREQFPGGNASGAFAIVEPPTAITQVAPDDSSAASPRRR